MSNIIKGKEEVGTKEELLISYRTCLLTLSQLTEQKRCKFVNPYMVTPALGGDHQLTKEMVEEELEILKAKLLSLGATKEDLSAKKIEVDSLDLSSPKKDSGRNL